MHGTDLLPRTQPIVNRLPDRCPSTAAGHHHYRLSQCPGLGHHQCSAWISQTPPTVSLQAKAKDIVAATGETDIVKATLQNLRDNINVHHKEYGVYESSVCVCYRSEVQGSNTEL